MRTAVARIPSEVRVQMNGGPPLFSVAVNRWITAMSSLTGAKLSRQMARRVAAEPCLDLVEPRGRRRGAVEADPRMPRARPARRASCPARRGRIGRATGGPSSAQGPPRRCSRGWACLQPRAGRCAHARPVAAPSYALERARGEHRDRTHRPPAAARDSWPCRTPCGRSPVLSDFREEVLVSRLGSR